MRMQNEVIALKERELALKRQLLTRTVPKIDEVLPSHPNDEDDDALSRAECSTADDMAKPKVKVRQQQPSSVTQGAEELLELITGLQEQLEKYESNLTSITDKYREALLETNRLIIVEEQLQHLRNTIAASEAEKDTMLAKQSEEIGDLKIAQQNERMRRQYADDDLHQQRCATKLSKEQSNRLIYSLRKQLIDHNKAAAAKPIPKPRNHQPDEELVRENALIKFKLSKVSQTLLDRLKTDDEAIVLKHFNRFGVVQADFAVDFITKQEVEQLKGNCQRLQSSNQELTASVKRLEELLRLSEAQIKRHQESFRQQSEEEIALRHLIVDLQSESNAQYIIAKTSRELLRSQANEEVLKAEIVQMQVEIEMQKKELENVEANAEQMVLDAKSERDNNDLKLRLV